MVKERDYSNGKIYKITSFQTDDIYIGSTCNPYLSTRFSKHKNHYKSYLNGDFTYISSFEIMKYPDAKIELIILFPCKCIEELTAKESEYIRNLNCVNKQVPNRTSKEYYQDNKEKIKNQVREYTSLNKEQIENYQKEYVKTHREEKRAYDNMRVICPNCSKELNRSSLKKHIKKYHAE